MSVFLFAGDYDQRGTPMQYYIDQYEAVDDAVDVANKQHYDWAEVVTATDKGLTPVTSGIFDPSHSRMIWQHEKAAEK